MTALRFSELNMATFGDLEMLFSEPGCSVARSCWCVAYRFSGEPPVDAGLSSRDGRRELLRKQVQDGHFVGLVAHDSQGPVGWTSFGPREDFAVLRRSPVMKPVDDTPVWSIVCFVVPKRNRRQGVAGALLRAAQREAASRGRTLEAYPVDSSPDQHDDWLWFGTTSMFLAAGFTEVARRKPRRPVMRWTP